MSQITLAPAATGTGVFTVAAPATNTNQTLTLPDNAGTLLSDASNIEAQVKNAVNAGGTAPVYGCRAWVNFDGTRDSTGATSTANTARFIRASGNVASVVRNAVGDYTVTFTTSLPDANYVFNVMSGFTGGSAGIPVPHQSGMPANTASSFRFSLSDANSYAATKDQANVYVSVFR